MSNFITERGAVSGDEIVGNRDLEGNDQSNPLLEIG